MFNATCFALIVVPAASAILTQSALYKTESWISCRLIEWVSRDLNPRVVSCLLKMTLLEEWHVWTAVCISTESCVNGHRKCG